FDLSVRDTFAPPLWNYNNFFSDCPTLRGVAIACFRGFSFADLGNGRPGHRQRFNLPESNHWTIEVTLDFSKVGWHTPWLLHDEMINPSCWPRGFEIERQDHPRFLNR